MQRELNKQVPSFPLLQIHDTGAPKSWWKIIWVPIPVLSNGLERWLIYVVKPAAHEEIEAFDERDLDIEKDVRSTSVIHFNF